MLRLLRRRAGRSAGGALQQSEQLSACRPPARRRIAQDRKERRAVRRSVEQPRQPQGALRLDRPGNLGGDRRQDRRLHLLDRHRRHDRRRFDVPAREEKGHRDRRCRSARRGDVQPVHARRGESVSEGGSITEGIGLGRVTPIIEDIKVDKAYLIPDEEAVPIIFDLLEHEGLASAARPASTSRARSGSPRSSAPATPS